MRYLHLFILFLLFLNPTLAGDDDFLLSPATSPAKWASHTKRKREVPLKKQEKEKKLAFKKGKFTAEPATETLKTDQGTPYTPRTLSLFKTCNLHTPERALLRMASKLEYQKESKNDTEIMIEKENLDPEFLSPYSSKRYLHYHRNAKNPRVYLEKSLRDFVHAHPHPIKSRPYRAGKITDNVATHFIKSRTVKRKLFDAGVIESPFKPLDYEEPYKPDTAEEHAAKKEKIRLAFEAREKERGLTKKNLNSIFELEESYWESYFEVLLERKESIDTKKDAPLTKGELESFFDIHLEPHYKTLRFGRYCLFYAKEFIDLGRVDDTGKRTNLQRLQRKLCPIGYDNKEMNFHHFTLHDAKTHGTSYGTTYIVLLSDKFHKKYSGLLHLTDTYYSSVPRKRVDRNLWGKARQTMCLKLSKTLNQSQG